MARLEFFLAAKSASVDRFSNELSLFEVLEELRPPAVPSSLPSLVAVSCWLAEAEDAGQDFQVTIRISGPPIGDAVDFPQNFQMGQALRHRVFHRFQGIPLVGPGDLVVEVLLNGEHRAQHTITVHPPQLVPTTG